MFNPFSPVRNRRIDSPRTPNQRSSFFSANSSPATPIFVSESRDAAASINDTTDDLEKSLVNMINHFKEKNNKYDEYKNELLGLHGDIIRDASSSITQASPKPYQGINEEEFRCAELHADLQKLRGEVISLKKEVTENQAKPSSGSSQDQSLPYMESREMERKIDTIVEKAALGKIVDLDDRLHREMEELNEENQLEMKKNMEDSNRRVKSDFEKMLEQERKKIFEKISESQKKFQLDLDNIQTEIADEVLPKNQESINNKILDETRRIYKDLEEQQKKSLYPLLSDMKAMKEDIGSMKSEEIMKRIEEKQAELEKLVPERMEIVRKEIAKETGENMKLLEKKLMEKVDEGIQNTQEKKIAPLIENVESLQGELMTFKNESLPKTLKSIESRVIEEVERQNQELKIHHETKISPLLRSLEELQSEVSCLKKDILPPSVINDLEEKIMETVDKKSNELSERTESTAKRVTSEAVTPLLRDVQTMKDELATLRKDILPNQFKESEKRIVGQAVTEANEQFEDTIEKFVAETISPLIEQTDEVQTGLAQLKKKDLPEMRDSMKEELIEELNEREKNLKDSFHDLIVENEMKVRERQNSFMEEMKKKMDEWMTEKEKSLAETQEKHRLENEDREKKLTKVMAVVRQMKDKFLEWAQSNEKIRQDQEREDEKIENMRRFVDDGLQEMTRNIADVEENLDLQNEKIGKNKSSLEEKFVHISKLLNEKFSKVAEETKQRMNKLLDEPAALTIFEEKFAPSLSSLEESVEGRLKEVERIVKKIYDQEKRLEDADVLGTSESWETLQRQVQLELQEFQKKMLLNQEEFKDMLNTSVSTATVEVEEEVEGEDGTKKIRRRVLAPSSGKAKTSWKTVFLSVFWSYFLVGTTMLLLDFFYPVQLYQGFFPT